VLDETDPDRERMKPNPSDPLFHETATTLPVDFHSFRRAFNTALAEAGVNVQHAMHLASHSDPKVHARYVMNTLAMRTIPSAALPRLPMGPLVEAYERDGNVTARDDSTEASPEVPEIMRCGRDSNPRMTVLQTVA
jgi:hypothetical protein